MICVQKKIGCQIQLILAAKKIRPEKDLGPRSFASRNILGQKKSESKIFCPKMLFPKNFGHKNCGSKKLSVTKKFGQKKIWVKRKIG